MVRIVVFLFPLIAVPDTGYANAWDDCSQKQDLGRQISGCSELILGGKLGSEHLAAAYGGLQ